MYNIIFEAMNNDIYLIGEVGFDITLESVIELVNKTDKNKPLNVYIHSGGGSVYDGVAIYNYFKNLPQEVNTIATGLVASIASVFYLAGKKRTAYAQNRILIHLPMSGGMGNASDFEALAKDLREEEQKIADIYVSETGFTKEEAISQMQEDKMFTTEQLLEKGFITELKNFKAVANLNNKPININNEKMSKESLTKEEATGLLDGFMGKIKNILKPSLKNKLVQDANGTEIDFTDLEEGDTPSVGDKATIDGASAEGELLMPSGETYVFSKGELTEIQPKADDSEEMESLQQEVVNLKKELKAENKAVATLSKDNDLMKNLLQEAQKDIKAINKSIGSDFKHEVGEKKNEIERGARSVWKK